MKTRDPWKVVLPMGRPQTFAREADAVAFAAANDGTVEDTRKPKPVDREGAATALRAVKAANDIPPENRAAVRRRSGGRCEARLPGCTGSATGMHHRLKRRLGCHAPENLVDTCTNCHTASPAAIERNRGWSERVGLIIPSWEGPPSEAWVRPPYPWCSEALNDLP